MPALTKTLTALASVCALLGALPAQAATDCSAQRGCAAKSVSYTHLTLPTSDLV